MKVTSIDLIANDREIASFSFRDPTSRNPYTAKGMFGLDADEIISKYYGQNFYNLAQTKRNVVIRIALNPDFAQGRSYSELRDDLYRAIASNRSGLIELLFKHGDAPVASISGKITKFEAPLFNEVPEVQITIKCSDSMVRGAVPYYENLFEMASEMAVIDTLSTAPHGFKFSVEFTEGVDAFFIADSWTDETWRFEFSPGTINPEDGGPGFYIGDVLYFSSEVNNKYLYVERHYYGVEDDVGWIVRYHLIDTIVPGSVWPIIFPGANNFVFYPESGYDWKTFEYYPTYWGV